MRKLAFLFILAVTVMSSSLYSGAQCTTNCVITNPAGSQTITQGSGTSLNIAGNLSPQTLDYIMFVDTFSGTDIGAKMNSAITAIPSGACSVVLVLPPGQTAYTATTTVNLPALSCALPTPLSISVGGKLIVDFNGAHIAYTGTGDFLTYYSGADGNGPYQTLEIKNLHLWGTSSSTGCGIHTRAGHFHIHDSTIWDFTAGNGICMENYSGGFQEQWHFSDLDLGNNAKGIRLFQSATSPGTNSFFYGTIDKVHFDLTDIAGNGCTDCIYGISVEGVLIGSTQYHSTTYGNKWDLAYNMNCSTAQCAVINVANGGQLFRAEITTRGEQTSGTAQSCTVNIADTASSVNTALNRINPAPTEPICVPATWTGFYCNSAVTASAYEAGDSFFEGECGSPATRQTIWKNHTGNAGGFTYIYAAAPSTERDGGMQIYGRHTTTATGDGEADRIGSSGNPFYNVSYCDGQGPCGFGAGFHDTTFTGYAISSISRSGATVTATLTTAPTGLSAGTHVLVEGVTDPSFNIGGDWSLTAVNSTTPPYTVTWSQPGYNTVSSTGGGIYGPLLYPSVTVDILSGSGGGFRLGQNTTGTSAGFTGSAYGQLSTFSNTTAYSAPAITSGCEDENVSVSGPNGVLPTTSDIPLTVIANNALGTGTVSAIKTGAAGVVTLHFCAVTHLVTGTPNYSWTPPASTTYTVIMIH